MKKSMIVVAGLLSVVLWWARHAQAAQMPIGDILWGPMNRQEPNVQIGLILGDLPSYTNQRVIVEGVVEDPRVIEPVPGAGVEFRGEYVLGDVSGKILVKTTSNPPAKGVVRRVEATVEVSATGPVLVETGGAGVPLPLLIAALAALVVLAVVLVVLVVRKRAGLPTRCAPQ